MFRSLIVKLDTPERREQWNNIIKTINRNNEWWGHYGERIRGMNKSGHNYADVAETRVNPAVCIMTKDLPKKKHGHKMNDSEVLTFLESLTKMPELMAKLMAYMPYSVVSSESPEDETVLILPMGLQKTPGGFGWTRRPDPQYHLMEGADGKDIGKYKIQPRAVKKVIPTFVSLLKARYPRMVLMTRASTDSTPGAIVSGGAGQFNNGNIWKSGVVKTWERLFPGRFRLFWKAYDSEDIHVPGEEDEPDTYDPQLGGASVVDGNLVIDDVKGTRIFSAKIAGSKPIARMASLLGINRIGTLITAFPDEDMGSLKDAAELDIEASIRDTEIVTAADFAEKRALAAYYAAQPKLAQGWEKVIDSKGRLYVNRNTGESQREFPYAPAIAYEDHALLL
jgi:hypothetical protein